MGGVERVRVEVVYARPDTQRIAVVHVARGTCIETAIRQSGLLRAFPEIDLTRVKLGIYGRRAEATQIVREGDRIEIYRPLLADAKSVRRQRANQTPTRE